FTIDGIFSNEWMFQSVLIYSIIGISIILYIFYERFIVKENVKKDTWYYKTIFLIVIVVYGLFYITNPWYTLQTHPRLFLYQDGKNITNKGIYFYLTERYGFNETLYKPFRTMEDSIEGLEFAMENNEYSLYKKIFYDLEKYGYINVLKIYNDKTFQSYMLRKLTYININNQYEKNFFYNNLKVLDYLKEKGLDSIVRDVAIYTENEYGKFKQGNINEKDFYERIDYYGDKIYDVIGINSNMFIQSEHIMYKKNKNGDWELIKSNFNY
ncbi:MAG: hypothetical protein PHN31_06690, partial [Candidatus Gracilibacteria bacterium]|nr:hypothetical protein [Candidatus Gracilibacteria bacterium]